MSNVILALAIIERLVCLIDRAMTAGEDISDEELDAAFDRADAAEDAWNSAGGDDEEGA